MIQRIETRNIDGTVTVEEIVLPDPEPSESEEQRAAVLAAVETARTEVSGYATSNGTRQAVEALATAVEALVQGDTP